MTRSIRNVPRRKRRAAKTVTWSTPLTYVRYIASRQDRYEVLCQPRDLSGGRVPVDVVPREDLVYHGDFQVGASGPTALVPEDEDLVVF